jgi:hypothetical protein
MRRALAIVFALTLLAIPVATALAADGGSLPKTGRVIIATGDVSVPSGEQADAVIVTNGTADIAGQVNTVLVLDGDAVLTGATVETVVAVGGTVQLNAGTTVLGDVWTAGATVEQDPSAVVQGTVGSLDTQLATLGVLLVPILFLVSIGIGLVAIVAALVLAGLAARQVREAEDVIRRRPGTAIGAGILGVLVPPLLAGLMMITVIGIPLALAFLFVAWPAVAFAGYLVAAIFVGDALVGRMRGGAIEERPYLAAILGVLVLAVAGIVPFVGAVASLFGLGALIVLGWEVWRGGALQSAGGVPSPA